MLFQNNNKRIEQNCKFTFKENQDFLIQLTNKKFLLFHSDLKTLKMTCPDAESQSVSFKGLREINVPDMCSMSTPSFCFEGRADVFSSPNDVSVVPVDFADILGNDVVDHLSEIENLKLRDMDLIGSKKGLKIPVIKMKLSAHRQTKMILFWAGAVAAIFAVSIFFLCCLRLQKWFLGSKAKYTSVWQGVPIFGKKVARVNTDRAK